jgi:hypothetical protein
MYVSPTITQEDLERTRAAHAAAVTPSGFRQRNASRTCSDQKLPKQPSTLVVVVEGVNDTSDAWTVAEETRRNEPWLRCDGGGPKNKSKTAGQSRRELWNQKVNMWEELFRLGAFNSIEKVEEFLRAYHKLEVGIKREMKPTRNGITFLICKMIISLAI